MAAADHLSPRLFHSTNAALQPGDLIHPGYRRKGGEHLADDYKHIGHGDFAWASADKPKTSFGKRYHYEVEPTGLANPYTMHEDGRSGVSARADNPHAYPSQQRMDPGSVHANNWVSLAPLRVKGRVNGKGEPYESGGEDAPISPANQKGKKYVNGKWQ